MKKQFSCWVWVLSFVALLGVAAGCTGSSEPSAGGRGQTSPSTESSAPSTGWSDEQRSIKTTMHDGPSTSWKHGIVLPKGDSAFQYMAEEKGFWQELGLDVEILPMDGDAIMLKALIAGELDSMEAAPTGTFAAIEQGADLKLVGTTIPRVTLTAYAHSDIRNIADLKGKTIGISGIASFPHILWVALMKQAGLEPVEAEFVQAGGAPIAFQAMLAGKVDATIAGPENHAVIEKDDNFHVLADLWKDLPTVLRYTLIVGDKTIQTRPDDLEKFLTGYTQGIRYAYDHRDEALALAARITQSDKVDPGLAMVYDILTEGGAASPNLALSEDEIMATQEVSIDVGLLKQKLPIDRVADFRFRGKVIERLGPYN